MRLPDAPQLLLLLLLNTPCLSLRIFSHTRRGAYFRRASRRLEQPRGARSAARACLCMCELRVTVCASSVCLVLAFHSRR